MLSTRRQFLQASTALVTGAAAGPLCVSAARAGLFLSMNGAVAPRVGPWPEFARLASRIGYGGIDWSFAPVKAAGLDATKALLADLQLKPTIVNLPMARPFPFAGDDAGFDDALTSLADDSAFAQALGCDKMMLVLSATTARPKDEQRALVRDRLARISEVLRRANIRLGLEFLGPQYMHMGAAGGPAVHPFIYTLPETVQLAKDSGPNVGVVLDIWHWHHSGGTLDDIVAAGADRIVHVHLSDAKAMAPDAVRDNMRVLPGEGIVNVTGFLQTLQKIGYAGGISPEPLGRFPNDMPTEEAARLAFDSARAAMRKAGVA